MFGLEPKRHANSHSQFEPLIQNTSFFQNLKFGKDIAKNDIINLKMNLFLLALENQLRFRIWLFHNF